MSDNILIKDGSGTSVTVISKDTGAGVQLPGHHLADPTTPSQKAAVTSGNALKVDGSAVTQPVSAAALPLPAGASTAAKQPALGTAGTASADVISVQGIASMTKLLVTPDALPAHQSTNVDQLNGTTTDTNSGAKSGGTLRVVLATDQPALTNALLVTAAGDVAAGSSDSGNPVKVGAKAINAEITALTNAQRSNLLTDLVGKLITLPYANPEQFENGTTAAITDTTSTAVLAAAGAGVRHYITSIIVTNSHATQGTFVKILDGSSIIWEGYAAALGGGFCISFPVPLRGTANTAVNAQCVTTGSNTIASVAGYKGV